MKVKSVKKNENIIETYEKGQLVQWIIILLVSIEIFALSLIILKVNFTNIDIPLMVSGFFVVFCLVGVLVCNKND